MKKLFGTDGIRGKANTYPMTSEIALEVGKAVGHFFRNEKKRNRIVIGKDTRLSGYMIEYALVSGICSTGTDVLLVGPLPTPAIAHLTKSLNCEAGIVISASHNPAEDNGIKIFSKTGFKLDDKIEKELENLILEKKVQSDHISGKDIGKAYRVDDAKGRYIEFCKHTINSMDLQGMKIVLDCANGAAYNVAPTIFSELGAELIVLNSKPDGLNINENCGALHPEELMQKVKENNADLGLAFDGDADRLIVCDEQGKIVDGDHLLGIYATNLKEENMLKNNLIVSTVMSNIGLKNYLDSIDVELITAKVGDRYVLEEMQSRKAVIGGEQSGHLIFLDHATTGDGIIAGLQLVRIIKKQGKKLSKLASAMKSLPQSLVNIKVREKRPFEEMEKVNSKIKEINTVLGNNGRTLVRYSGTENKARVMVEADSTEKAIGFAEEIAELIRQEVGE